MEHHLDGLIPLIVKRASDTNVFIAEEGIESLLAMCHNCNESKVLQYLLLINGNRSPIIKVNIAKCLDAVSFNY
jgi:hypothetical protein